MRPAGSASARPCSSTEKSEPYLRSEHIALALGQVPVPVMARGVSANRFVVVERVQNFTFGPLGCPFLLAYRTVHGESDKHFSHSTLLVGYGASALSGHRRLRVKARAPPAPASLPSSRTRRLRHP